MSRIKVIDLGVTYKKVKRLPLTWEGQQIQAGTKAHTTDGVWWVYVGDGEWKRLDGPEYPFLPMWVELD